MDNPENVEFRMKIISSHFTAFNRQISEAVRINRNMGPYLLNSKAEYNRSSLPTIKTSEKKSPWELSDLEDQDYNDAVKILKESKRKLAVKMKLIKEKKKEEEEMVEITLNEEIEEEAIEKESTEGKLIEECNKIEKENSEKWKERKEFELEMKEKEEKEMERERRVYRAKLQKEEFMRKYLRKKKERLVWSDIKIAEKKMLWRKFRE